MSRPRLNGTRRCSSTKADEARGAGDRRSGHRPPLQVSWPSPLARHGARLNEGREPFWIRAQLSFVAPRKPVAVPAMSSPAPSSHWMKCARSPSAHSFCLPEKYEKRGYRSGRRRRRRSPAASARAGAGPCASRWMLEEALPWASRSSPGRPRAAAHSESVRRFRGRFHLLTTSDDASRECSFMPKSSGPRTVGAIGGERRRLREREFPMHYALASDAPFPGLQRLANCTAWKQ